MKRSWPSVNAMSRWNVSRQRRGATNGRRPSITRINASAIQSEFPIASSTAVPAARWRAVYLAGGGSFDARPDPYCLKYWKNSALGSSTSTSLLLRNVAL